MNIATGSVLKGAVREAGKSQADIAAAIDQSITTIQRIFAGKRNVTITQFIQIADYIGIAPDDLLDRVTKRLAQMSEPPVSLDARRPKSIADMTDEELEGLRSVANTDPEIGYDEPDAP